jgi:hypothetical protein
MYHTLCIRDDSGEFCDVFGSYDRKEIKSEIEFAYYDIRKKDIRIISTNGTSAELIAALAELNA